jgi:hypothetical protein
VLPATAALLPRCCRAAAVAFIFIVIVVAAVNALTQRCWVGWSFWWLVSRFIGRLAGPNVSTTYWGLTF